MGHQHHFTPSYMLEIDNEQNWNFAENSYMPAARNGTGSSSSLVYHTANMSIDGPQYTHCNHTPTSNGYSSLPHHLQIPNYQQDVAGSSDLSMLTLHTPSGYIPPQDYRIQPSSSNYNSGNPFNEEDLFDIRVGNQSGNQSVQYKRKSPGVPEGQNSSNVPMIDEPWSNVLHAPSDYHITNPNSLSVDMGNSLRNVRSRSTFDLEPPTNLARDFYTTSRLMDNVQNLNGLNPTRVSSAVNENGSLNYQQLNPFLEQSSTPSSSVVTAQQNNGHVFRNFPSSSVQSVRGVRSGFSQSQRPTSSFRVSSTSLTDEGLQLSTNNHHSRHLRPSSSIGWHTSDRRYRTLSRVNVHDHSPPEGVMIMDRSAVYGSRNSFDQHREMRLDIDDMSYEELLALGERIGSVGTGLPDHLISKCIQESIYCASDQIQEEPTCVICLEEYANMDDVGMLRVCGHDFHVGCIRKWLSMKNLCPICKAEPVKQK